MLAVLDEDGVRDVSQDLLEEPLGLLQRLPGPLALDGVADDAHHHLAIHHPLDQIVLRAPLHRFDAHRFVIHACQHHNGHLWRLGPHPGQRVQPLAVRQPQIQEDHVRRFLVQALQRGGEPLGDLETRFAPHVGQHLLDEPRVSPVVLDQQDPHWQIAHLYLLSGGLARAGREPSTAFTAGTIRSTSSGPVMCRWAWRPRASWTSASLGAPSANRIPTRLPVITSHGRLAVSLW